MAETATVHEYSAESARQGIVRWLAPVLHYPTLLLRNRGLIWNFFRRELLGRFRGSVLGVFWVLIQPLFLFALYYAVFGLLLGPKVKGLDGIARPDPNFALYLFAGVLAWSFYVEGASRACTVIVDNGNLVKKVAFPCEVLPVHPVLTAGLVYLVGVVVMLACGAALGAVHVGGAIAAFPLVLLVHCVFTVGIGLFLAALQVFMRDASHLLSIAHQALMFASGTFITVQQIEEVKAGASAFVTWLPWYHLLQAHRVALGVESYATPALWSHLGIAAAWGVGFLVLGYAAFMSRRHKFADLV